MKNPTPPRVLPLKLGKPAINVENLNIYNCNSQTDNYISGQIIFNWNTDKLTFLFDTTLFYKK